MAIVEIIDERTDPGIGAQERLKLFPATPAQGDALFAELSAASGDGLSVVRNRPQELTVARDGRTWKSIDDAFAAAREIADGYGLTACEADIGVPVMPADPGRQGQEESLDTVLPGCWAPEEDDLKDRKHWAVTAIKADRAWDLATARGLPSAGQGIVIAQPDTGITTHVELAGVPYWRPLNLLGDGQSADDATDPLVAIGNPGHGTATASVVVSRAPAEVVGSAPAATLMPIRAIERVVQPSMVKVAEAVDHAVASGAHVITMSLGGVWSFSLWSAIERAVASDVIVMAAAGNCVGIVVWPAQLEACIGVGGVDQHFAPWRGSSHGPQVDISAPAQNVYRADAKTRDVGQGQGTSFAVALTAGVAACWLAYHGRSSLIAAARERDETLQRMFTRLVRATAQRPATGWNDLEMGAGIVDAEALLKADFDLGLETEGPVAPRIVPDPARSLRAAAAAQIGREALDPHIDWTKDGTRLSRELLRRRLSPTELPQVPAAPAVLRPATPAALSDKARRLRSQIVAGQASAGGAQLESLESLESAGSAPLTSDMAEAVLERVTARVTDVARARQEQGQGNAEAVRAAVAMLRDYGSAAMRKLVAAEDGAAGGLDRDEEASLEAIIIADGTRPSFLIENNLTPAVHPFMGTWGAMVGPLQTELEKLAAAVGRIQPRRGHNGNFIGTGSLVDAGRGVVLTNYHVLEDAISKFFVPVQQVSATQIRILADLEIDFVGEATSLATNSFRVVEANLLPSSGRGFGRVDAVTLRIEPLGEASVLPNAAITFSPKVLDYAKASERSLCTIGFPGRPRYQEAPSGRVNWDFVVKTLFGDVFGVKRLAPGRVIAKPGDVEKDTLRLVFGHDATTFQGASGSPVFAWGVDGQPAIGLHFAGDNEISNYSLTSNLVADQFRALGVPM